MRIVASLFAAPLVLPAGGASVQAVRSGRTIALQFDARCTSMACGQHKGQLQ